MRAIVSRAGFRGPGGAHVRASRDPALTLGVRGFSGPFQEGDRTALRRVSELPIRRGAAPRRRRFDPPTQTRSGSRCVRRDFDRLIRCDAILMGWTQPRRSDYLQATVQESWGGTHTAARMSRWRDQFLAAGQAGLKDRATTARDEDNRRLQAKIGELLMENELLYAKMGQLEAGVPLARRRSTR